MSCELQLGSRSGPCPAALLCGKRPLAVLYISMELREYWSILRRRWWIPLLLGLLVAALSLLQLQPWQPKPSSYAASLRMLVGVMPATAEDVATYYDPRYYAWLTSEYLVDDFTEVVGSQLFARNVSERLAGQNIIVPPGVIQGSAATGKLHRIITLNMSHGDDVQLRQIADAAAGELAENAPAYFQQLGTAGAGVTLIDGPTVSTVGPSVRDQIELPLRVLLGVLVGIGLVFLLHYLDMSVRAPADLEALGLPVLGQIPRRR
jgi:capsular polysaccharide biosynthesis protein